MKLTIFGLTITSSWGNGHASIWRGLCAALARRGHHVVFFERDVPYYATTRDYHELPGGGLQLYDDWDEVCPRARREVMDSDLAVVTSYCPDALAATALVCEADGPLRVFYDMDTPVTLAQLKGAGAVSYVGPRGLRDFDLVLSYTGGAALCELRARLGARRTAPLYGCVDPAQHRAAPPVEEYRADLSYLGTWAADRQAVLETLLLEPARRRPDLRFLIGGALYPVDFPWASNLYFVRHVPPPRHPAFYSSARLTLNITRQAMAELGYCPSGRLFEAAACGAPILSDCWPGLEEFFTPGLELLVARETKDALQALALADAELARLARRARERVLDEHTSDHRARELEALVGASDPAAVAAPGGER